VAKLYGISPSEWGCHAGRIRHPRPDSTVDGGVVGRLRTRALAHEEWSHGHEPFGGGGGAPTDGTATMVGAAGRADAGQSAAAEVV